MQADLYVVTLYAAKCYNKQKECFGVVALLFYVAIRFVCDRARKVDPDFDPDFDPEEKNPQQRLLARHHTREKAAFSPPATLRRRSGRSKNSREQEPKCVQQKSSARCCPQDYTSRNSFCKFIAFLSLDLNFSSGDTRSPGGAIFRFQMVSTSHSIATTWLARQRRVQVMDLGSKSIPISIAISISTGRLLLPRGR